MKINDIKPGICLSYPEAPFSLALFLIDKVYYLNEDFYSLAGGYIRLKDGHYFYAFMKVIDRNCTTAQNINASVKVSRTLFDEAKAKYDEYLSSISDITRRIHTELQQ